MTKHEVVKDGAAADTPRGGISCLSPRRPADAPEVEDGKYSRLFPELPSLNPAPEALAALGRSGGACDGGSAGAEANVAAGWPMFGQFIAHDITADRSPLERLTHQSVANHRAPRLNLESVYGAGPTGSPYQFDGEDPAKFLLAENGADVPRSRQGTAIIPDPRNDSHLFMSSMHLAFMKAHNAFVDAARRQGIGEDRVFDAARQALTWHYQWVVAEEFLPGVVGDALMAEIRSGAVSLPLAPGLTLPYEFSDAAYRYGHSQIRQSYQLQADGPVHPLYPDLLGFRPLDSSRAVDWRVMFDGDPTVTAQRAMRISERLPMALIKLPAAVTGEVKDKSYRSLANRDMRRGWLTELPSGEAVASAFGVARLSKDEIGLSSDWSGETPLWYYIGREADTLGNGDQLGPVGGRLVAGVLMSLIERDPASFLSLEPSWRPEIATVSDDPSGFKFLDLLLYGDTAA